MPNEFVVKNGLISQGNITGTGSLVMSQNITASNISASGTGSFNRVGIGTTNPKDVLDFGNVNSGKSVIFGYSSYGEVKNSLASIIGNNVKASPTGNSQVMRFASTDYSGSFIKIVYNKGVTFHTNITSALNTDISEDTNERMRINLNGNVGIGSTSPSNKLDVLGNISASTITATLTGTSSWAQSASVTLTSLTASSLVTSSTYTVNSLSAITSLSSSRVVVAGTASNDTDAITRGYVLSRGQNLMTNGYGDLNNNYNFPSSNFDPVDTYAGAGSFSYTSPGYNQTVITTEYLSVDSNKTYLGSLYAKAGNLNGTLYTSSALVFVGMDCYDIDKNQIGPLHVKKVTNSQDTYLIQNLNPGDSFMVVSGSAAGWYTGSTNIYERQMVWWPYTSSLGYVFTPFTYTRKISSTSTGTGILAASASFYNTNGLWNTTAITSSATGSIINLTSVWGGPLIPSGSPVRNASSGGTFKYSFANSVALQSGSWTRLAARIEGTDTSSLDSNTRQFRPETKFIRFIFLPNYASTLVPLSASIHRFSAITFSEQPDSSGSAFVQGGNIFNTTALLGTNDAQALAFETNNTERVRITSAGNVGIGTTNPVNRLDVVGNISASVITASLFSGSFSGSTFGTASWSTNALTASALNTANSYRIVGLTATGNITASNISASSTGSSFGRINVGAVTTSSYAVNTYGLGLGLDLSNNTGTSIIPVLSVKASSSAAPFSNVFSVQNSTSTNQYNLIFGQTSGQSVFIGAGESAAVATSLVGWGDEYLYLAADEGIKIITNTQGNAAGCFYPVAIAPSGSVRIQYALSGSQFVAPSTLYTLQVSGSNTQGLLYVQSAAAPNALFVSGSGNVGIGTNNPVNKLDVAGNISCSVVTGSLFSGSVSGSVFGTSSWAQSASNAIASQTAATADGLNASKNYQITSLYATGDITASNISASGIISCSILVGTLTGSVFGTSSWAQSASFVSLDSNAFVQNGNSFGAAAVLGTNDTNNLQLETNAIVRMTIGSGGQIATGTSTTTDGRYRMYLTDIHSGSRGSSSLYVSTTQRQNLAGALTTIDNGIYNRYDITTVTQSNSVNNIANYNHLIFNTSASFSGSYESQRNEVRFVQSAAFPSNANIVNTRFNNTFASGITASAQSIYTGPLVGISEDTNDTISGSFTNIYAFAANAPFGGTTGNGISITNAYGLYLFSQKSNPVTNAYGIFQAGSNDYNQFSGFSTFGTSTTQTNNRLACSGRVAIGSTYFSVAGPTNGLIVQGNTGIGTSNPVNRLDVAGNISCSIVTGSFAALSSSNYAYTSSMPNGTFAIIEDNNVAFFYYKTQNGTLRSASLN